MSNRILKPVGARNLLAANGWKNNQTISKPSPAQAAFKQTYSASKNTPTSVETINKGAIDLTEH